VACILKTGRIFSPALLLDLSAEGAFIKSNEVIHRGSEVTLLMNLQGRDGAFDLSVQAEVVHSGRYLQGDGNFSGFGVRFKDLDGDAMERLNEVLLAAENQPDRKYILF
jgi:Tfp pilus assembly protein PilZ